MKIIKIKKVKSVNFISSSILIFSLIDFKAVSLMKVTTKTVNDPNIEDSEEYLNIRDTTNQVKINKKLNCNDKANNIPRYVATPFPPLNFNQIGKTCPKKTHRDEMYIYST